MAAEVREDPEPELRVAALEAFAEGPAEEGLAPLLAACADPCWSVRLTAWRGLGRLREPAAVPPLIAALGRERGRLRDEAGAALSAITGVGLPPDPERWEAWWRSERDRFRVPPRPAAAGRAPEESVARFSSIPIRSERVAFVLDRSASMMDPLERDGAVTKGDLVEAELEAALRRLPAEARFLLVAFGTEAVAFAPRPVPAPAAGRALAWFRKRRPEGRTNLHAGLALALGCEEVDTIFVLTDGAPSAGEHRGRGEVLRETARLNRWRKAVIHAVEVGAEATGRRWEGFLADLAAAHGGVHVRR